MNAATRAKARQALDRKLQGLREAPLSRPTRGWIRAVRTALGMSLGDVGARMGVTHQAIARLEQAESEGAITLSKLEEVALALGCRVEYALVPVEPLETQARRQAARHVLASIDRAERNMALEGEAVPEDMTDLVAEGLRAVAEGRTDLSEVKQERLRQAVIDRLAAPGLWKD